ncbi:U6 snRNA phosphodiesterase [Galendromus occidentalis]|uniref:U6 snRNA phosphodiesterase 1 n=1 Tax=Galendromus occidentalis TaxID=34638 RepID=A0AAJ7L5F5_9ACAR|nr:U6 snRNA phosphodiesterase [Galendromus occidentalis]XP_018496278.1 U6 snRNA phosphodiesterase [Galendromus occidentalis]XP_018496279.1 U6 snRNA phosphodiesterase [Galendromus occidentalis]XP_018496280.1 U6 snRNA phosphodiesterase [Galendromus occidentalis]
MSLAQLTCAYDSHTSSEGSNSSNSGESSSGPTTIPQYPPCKKNKLELPKEISGMFPSRNWTDEPEKHGGRRRAFEHEQGVWASHFFVQTCDKEYMDDVQKIACDTVPFLRRSDTAQSHISLSKTLKCRYHWIKPLYSYVRQGIQTRKPFLVSFSRFSVYENEEKNTCFLALDADIGANDLKDLSGRVDNALDHFNLPHFYHQPRFHVSIGWVPMHRKNDLLKSLADLQRELDDYCLSVELAGVVDRLCFRSGCKLYEIPLGIEIPHMQYTSSEAPAKGKPKNN